jgi:hypothetical protein
MATAGRRDILSFGVFLIIVVVGILLYQPLQVITDWTLIVPFIITLSGLWLIVLAGMRSSSPQKYEMGAFSTLSWGLAFVAIGGAWFLYGYGWYYSLVVLLIVAAAVAIVASMKKQ